MGRLEEVLENQKRSLKITEKVFGPEHHKTQTILNNLSLILQDLGRLDEALENQKRSLKIAEKVFGLEHY